MKANQTFMHEGTRFRKVTPSKKLFNSTMVHEVVNRGDVFAVRESDGLLTILPNPDKQIQLLEKEISELRVQLTLKMKQLEMFKGE